MGVKIVGRLEWWERLFWIVVALYVLLGILKRLPGIFQTASGIVRDGGPGANNALMALWSGIGLSAIAFGCIVAIVWLLRGGKK